MKQFKKLKKELLKRLSISDSNYHNIYNSTNSEELLNAVKDEFVYYCSKKVIDSDLIKKYEELFNSGQIYANVDVTDGYLLVDSISTVNAYGTSRVYAYSTSTVIYLR